MKNMVLGFAFLLIGGSMFAQSGGAVPTMEQSFASLVSIYQLDKTQQEKMLVIQKRKYRNLGEIEGLKTSDPKKYQEKIGAMQYANMAHMHQVLNEGQLKIFRQRQVELRQKKAELFKGMKSSGTSQPELEERLAEMDLDALLNG